MGVRTTAHQAYQSIVSHTERAVDVAPCLTPDPSMTSTTSSKWRPFVSAGLREKAIPDSVVTVLPHWHSTNRMTRNNDQATRPLNPFKYSANLGDTSRSMSSGMEMGGRTGEGNNVGSHCERVFGFFFRPNFAGREQANCWVDRLSVKRQRVVTRMFCDVARKVPQRQMQKIHAVFCEPFAYLQALIEIQAARLKRERSRARDTLLLNQLGAAPGGLRQAVRSGARRAARIARAALSIRRRAQPRGPTRGRACSHHVPVKIPTHAVARSSPISFWLRSTNGKHEVRCALE